MFNQYNLTTYPAVPLDVSKSTRIPVVTPEMFGAKADGITDDTAAIQAALNFVSTNGGGSVTLGFGSYLVNTGPVIVPANTGLVGQSGPGGSFLNGTNTVYPTQILNKSNNHTVSLANLNTHVNGVCFSSPQPVFQAVITTDSISAVGTRYPGFGLTPGVYNLVFSGGFGTGAAGTVTVGANGSVSSCSVTNGGSGYGAGGALAYPLVTAVVTGGGQKGAHIYLPGGADGWAVEDCAFFSKDFGILCNGNHLVTTVNGSYAAAGNQNIPIANTTGFAPLMLVNNPSNPQSLRQFNLIASGGVVTNNHIQMSFPVDQGSLGSSDTLIAGLPVYFTKGQILRSSFYGSNYWQIYLNIDAENVDIHDNFFVNPGNGAAFIGQGLAVTFERNNVDGVFHNKALAVQFTAPPSSIRDNTLGNVTGSTSDLTASGIYVNGRLVFGGSIVTAQTVISGNDLYSPLPRGFWLESVTGATFISNRIGTYDPTTTGFTACRSIVTDSLCYGNVFINGVAQEVGTNFAWTLGNTQNTIIGPSGTQSPLNIVTSAYTITQYDKVIQVNSNGGAFTIKLPVMSQGYSSGATFTITKTDAAGNTVTVSGNGLNINGSATYTGLTALYKYVTVVYSGTDNQWYITGSN